MLPAVLPVPIPADTLVIVVVPMNVQEVPRTIPVLMLLQPSAGQAAITAKVVRPEVHLIPALMSALLSAEAVMLVRIPVHQDPNLCPVLQPKTKFACLPLNADPVVILASTTPIAPFLLNHALTDVLLTILAASVQVVTPLQLVLILLMFPVLMDALLIVPAVRLAKHVTPLLALAEAQAEAGQAMVRIAAQDPEIQLPAILILTRVRPGIRQAPAVPGIPNPAQHQKPVPVVQLPALAISAPLHILILTRVRPGIRQAPAVPDIPNPAQHQKPVPAVQLPVPVTNAKEKPVQVIAGRLVLAPGLVVPARVHQWVKHITLVRMFIAILNTIVVNK